MYKISYFTEDDIEKVIAFIKENSFAIIVGSNKDFPVATHVPLDIQIINNKIIFTGHIMKNTDHHKAFADSNNVLVIFNGPHTYVSASWYVKPDVASTWNYITVHAKGKMKFSDEAGTRSIIEKLTDKYEKPESPAAFNKLPVEYVDRLVKAIIGFTIEVESIENVFKLSQNHDEQTRQSIMHHLNNNGSADQRKIAAEMLKRIDKPKQYK